AARARVAVLRLRLAVAGAHGWAELTGRTVGEAVAVFDRAVLAVVAARARVAVLRVTRRAEAPADRRAVLARGAVGIAVAILDGAVLGPRAVAAGHAELPPAQVR